MWSLTPHWLIPQGVSLLVDSVHEKWDFALTESTWNDLNFNSWAYSRKKLKSLKNLILWPLVRIYRFSLCKKETKNCHASLPLRWIRHALFQVYSCYWNWRDCSIWCSSVSISFYWQKLAWWCGTRGPPLWCTPVLQLLYSSIAISTLHKSQYIFKYCATSFVRNIWTFIIKWVLMDVFHCFMWKLASLPICYLYNASNYIILLLIPLIAFYSQVLYYNIWCACAKVFSAVVSPRPRVSGTAS
jgi:hypothetical protein